MLFFSILTSFSYFQNRYCSSTLFLCIAESGESISMNTIIKTVYKRVDFKLRKR